jgi:DNA-binding ferritin-like protein (Dps family)
MENSLPKSRIIKKGTLIKFDANANIIQRLYQVISFMLKSITREQISQYEKEMTTSFVEISKGNKEFSEEWMIHITTLSILIQQLEAAADEQNLIEEVAGEDLLKNAEAMIKNVIEEGSQLTDQSQSEPE